MRYEVEYIALVENTYVTLNRGDIVAGVAIDPASLVLFRIQKNEREDF